MTVSLTWFGHSTFALEADGKQVVIDPFFTGNPVNPIDASEVNPVAILITHAHSDHVGDAVAIGDRTGAPIITINELGNYLGSIAQNEVIPANHGGTVAFDGGTVKFTPAWHSSTFTAPDGTVVAPGIPAGLIVRFGGKTVYFAGDTALFGDMALIGEESLDVAVLPIGDHYTMGPADAIRAAKLLKAGAVVPCHYNTMPRIQQDGATFVADIEAQTSSKGILLQPGESTEI